MNLLGRTVIPLQTLPESGLMSSVDGCRTLIGPKAEAIVLVTPNNPTGATYSPALIVTLATLTREKNLAPIIGETCRDFIITGSSPHALLIFDRSSSVA